jgi:hypothetical protein
MAVVGGDKRLIDAHEKAVTEALHELDAAPKFLECGGLAGSGRATDVDGSIARVEDKRDGMLLFRS